MLEQSVCRSHAARQTNKPKQEETLAFKVTLKLPCSVRNGGIDRRDDHKGLHRAVTDVGTHSLIPFLAPGSTVFKGAASRGRWHVLLESQLMPLLVSSALRHV